MTSAKKTIFVSPLDPSLDEGFIKKHFSACGEVEHGKFDHIDVRDTFFRVLWFCYSTLECKSSTSRGYKKCYKKCSFVSF